MKILLIKLTSMGDVVHVLPAISDIKRAIPYAQIDCVVENSFVDIIKQHRDIDQVIAASTRQWRNLRYSTIKNFLRFNTRLRQQRYDVVIDAQGLMKSALLTYFSRCTPGGKKVGFCASVLKEKSASWFYQEQYRIDTQQHAIHRLRLLCAHSLHYMFANEIDYGLKQLKKSSTLVEKPSVFLAHGTTWDSKHLPLSHWENLIKLINAKGYQAILTWGNEAEKTRAECLAHQNTQTLLLEKRSIAELMPIISACNAVIAVDTGLAHLSAALGVKTISIYGSTDAKLTGVEGENNPNLQAKFYCSPCLLKYCQFTQPVSAPCYDAISIIDIWQATQLPNLH